MRKRSACVVRRVLADVGHVGTHDLTSITLHDFKHEGDPFLIGGELSVNIAKVLRQVANRKRAGRKFFGQLFFPQLARSHQKQVIDQDPLLVDPLARGRHPAWSQTTNVSVMTATGYPEKRPISDAKHGRNHRNIRKMSTAAKWVVQRKAIAFADIIFSSFYDRSHRSSHRTEMNWHMRL